MPTMPRSASSSTPSSARYPGDAILAEESGEHAGVLRDDGSHNGRTWVIDPLDGTVNYANGIPFYCVSIGLVVDDRPAVGVVLRSRPRRPVRRHRRRPGAARRRARHRLDEGSPLRLRRQPGRHRSWRAGARATDRAADPDPSAHGQRRARARLRRQRTLRRVRPERRPVAVGRRRRRAHRRAVAGRSSPTSTAGRGGNPATARPAHQRRGGPSGPARGAARAARARKDDGPDPALSAPRHRRGRAPASRGSSRWRPRPRTPPIPVDAGAQAERRATLDLLDAERPRGPTARASGSSTIAVTSASCGHEDRPRGDGADEGPQLEVADGDPDRVERARRCARRPARARPPPTPRAARLPRASRRSRRPRRRAATPRRRGRAGRRGGRSAARRGRRRRRGRSPAASPPGAPAGTWRGRRGRGLVSPSRLRGRRRSSSGIGRRRAPAHRPARPPSPSLGA